MSLTYSKYTFLEKLGLKEENEGVFDGSRWGSSGEFMTSINPSTGEPIARVRAGTSADYERCVQNMQACQKAWAELPAPSRGEIVRKIGNALRSVLIPLGELVALEMGKIRAEGIGEVQEFIDMCDLAVGMSRQLPGQVLPSERKGHVILEQWQPLGSIGVITAFNFPVAPLGWNLCLSLICGNTNIWKGASSTCLTTIAVSRLIAGVLEESGFCNKENKNTEYLGGAFTCIVGSGRSVGELFLNDSRLKLLSFTGSSLIGKRVSEKVHARFGRTILELGGNNATVVMEDGDIEQAVRASVFAAVGTCGQRCTSLRRLIVHESVFDKVKEKLLKAYKHVIANCIGDPLQESTLVGPLHTKESVEDEFLKGIKVAIADGGKLLIGGSRVDFSKSQCPSKRNLMSGFFVEPAIIEMNNVNAPILQQEIFAPVLFLLKCSSLEEAIQINNGVPQGLSSSIFTKDLQKMFTWIGPSGSDCGLVNVNIGPSGAEIGGAFGGEKETGGGRESGSDAWKQYMRRTTCTVNYSKELPLAQGIKFDVDV